MPVYEDAFGRAVPYGPANKPPPSDRNEFGGAETEASFAGQARAEDYRRSRSQGRGRSRSRSRSRSSSRDSRSRSRRSSSRDRRSPSGSPQFRGSNTRRANARRSDRERREHARIRSRSRSPRGRSRSRRRRSRSRSRSRSRRKSRSPVVRVPHGREPPSAKEQVALWAAQEAADALYKPVPSTEEEQLLLRRPPAAKAGDELTDEQVHFHFELMRIRRDQPQATARRLPYYRKLLKASSELSPWVPLPMGHSVWTALVQPRQFNRSDRTSTADILRQATVSETLVIGSASFTSSSANTSKVPPQPTTGLEYFKFAGLLAEFLVATGRLTQGFEADAHAKHVAHVMTLFEAYPAADVMLYDDDFRVVRHRLQDGRWHVPSEALLQRHIRDPVAERMAAYKTRDGGRDAGGRPKAPPGPPPKNEPNKVWERPGYKHRYMDGSEVCRAWSWGRCEEPCSHKNPKTAAAEPLVHKCSFCEDVHRLQDCLKYQATHPADHAIGQGGRGHGGGKA